jgi:hypothetical protein
MGAGSVTFRAYVTLPTLQITRWWIDEAELSSLLKILFVPVVRTLDYPRYSPGLFFV